MLNKTQTQTQITKYIKNGFHIHLIHAALQHITNNTFLSATICIKLYSINYFYWYGDLYTYLPNPRHNWLKQFIRFTDTGHIASFGYYFFPKLIPLQLAHNVHFIIMVGYWVGKLIFDLKDADRIDSSSLSTDIIEWHTDVCTYIHHTVPYMLIVYELWSYPSIEIVNNNNTLIYTYGWIYSWFFWIYLPWRFYTGDTVYSILDQKQTSWQVMLGFIGVIHIIPVFLSLFV